MTFYDILMRDLPILISCSYLSKYTAYKIMKQYNYNYDKELSTDENRVYTYSNENINELLVVYRGTFTWFDWITDILCLIGLKEWTFRYWNSIEIVNKIKNKYGAHKKVNAVGHSMGAFLLENSNVDGHKITYNKLVSFTDIGKKIDDSQTDIRESFDVVSLLETTQTGNHVTIPIVDLNPFSAHTTDDLIEANDHIVL